MKFSRCYIYFFINENVASFRLSDSKTKSFEPATEEEFTFHVMTWYNVGTLLFSSVKLQQIKLHFLHALFRIRLRYYCVARDFID